MTLEQTSELQQELQSESSSIQLDTLPSTIEVENAVASIPVKAQQVLALLACGFSVTSIASLSKVTPQAISNLVSRYDPEKKFTLTNKEKRLFLAKLWQARAGEALLRMTSEKLEECSAVDLANIAKIGQVQADKVLDEKEPAQKDPYAILRLLQEPRKEGLLLSAEPPLLQDDSIEA